MRLRLPPGAVVDVDVLRHGSWVAAVALPGLGSDLLDGIAVRGAPAFEAWLLSERRRIAAASEAILHEAALGRLAAGDLTAARGLAVRARRGEVHLTSGDPGAAARILQQDFARACQIGDPCWEGMAARSLALVAEAAGNTGRAFDLLADARRRSNRLADSYVWLDAHILGAQCELGRRQGHPDLDLWIDARRRLASRTGIVIGTSGAIAAR
ncbi:hypothetical protein [Paractinoplanes hotanensis]|uniref:Uncharacterized protein n=1 Tax=Paractinoplanes hotanensis TaxID=2906497 RepID=A0ABT0Y8V3_9ACTN|nr:hypothetical protein [Actinoplanes hotanensis]MCM4082464.1 hypothetical protein [Actinoplanes hotanensis]